MVYMKFLHTYLIFDRLTLGFIKLLESFAKLGFTNLTGSDTFKILFKGFELLLNFFLFPFFFYIY